MESEANIGNWLQPLSLMRADHVDGVKRASSAVCVFTYTCVVYTPYNVQGSLLIPLSLLPHTRTCVEGDFLKYLLLIISRSRGVTKRRAGQNVNQHRFSQRKLQTPTRAQQQSGIVSALGRDSLLKCSFGTSPLNFRCKFAIALPYVYTTCTCVWRGCLTSYPLSSSFSYSRMD